ncbi:MAG: sulfite oxidase-like oxidoreductase [Anaerolineales bacterium]|nr:sulfite oxidase-like oxidoreductase [Anaerolineales bacterium]MCB8991992.1 sulfite oxidase-like oxidoreductase [Ardenticatenaceae bacterium]MCB9004610.1 sulfite oxidase-like oxidoreductase [Ardenticatenaceae bacterium]
MLNQIFNRRDREQQMLQANRLPPGQSLTEKFPVLHYGPVPQVDLSTWTLRVFGAVEEEIVWSWEDFNKLPRTDMTLDLHCVTRWSKFDTPWEGVSLGQLVREGIIKPKPEAQYVVQHCEYGYTTNTPLDLVLQDNFLLATHFEGKPITPDHGYPLRGLVGTFADRSEPKSAYLWKGGKWLRALEFRADDQLGFWEQNGYHNEADPWTEQRFARGW